MLNPSGIIGAMANAYPSDRSYQGVLNGVRQGLGRNIDFAKQGDREAIGNALASAVRGSCARTGSRIPAC